MRIGASRASLGPRLGHYALPGRSALSFRVDIINLPSRTTFANPNLNPASTDFERITSATAASPRFIQFVSKFTF